MQLYLVTFDEEKVKKGVLIKWCSILASYDRQQP